ncbi:MAG: RNA polymerase sigma factor [Phycisphaerae bacterium]
MTSSDAKSASAGGRPDDGRSIGVGVLADPQGDLRAELAECGPAVRRFLFGMCGDWDQAEDMAQEALLRAWTRRESFDGRANARTWIFSIARNHWLDRLRRKKSQPQEQTMIDDQATPARTDAPYAGLWRGEVATAVRAALGRLPEEQREVLALRESEGLTFSQIASMLGIPAATAKSRARYALLKLAEELRPLAEHMDA